MKNKPLRISRITGYFEIASLIDSSSIQKLLSEIGGLVSEMTSTIPDGRKVNKVTLSFCSIPDRNLNPDQTHGQVRAICESE